MSRLMMIALAAVGVMELMPSAANAQYSVYIYNVRRPYQGWFRSGLTKDVNRSAAVCQASINQRVAENRRYGTDFEAFGIHRGTAQKITRPSSAVYVPRGYRVSIEAPEDGLILTHAPCGPPTPAEALATRRRPVTGRRDEVA